MPVPSHILAGLTEGASKLGTKEGYSGYGAEQGQAALREKIAANLYDGSVLASYSNVVVVTINYRLGVLGRETFERISLNICGIKIYLYPGIRVSD